MKCIHCGRDSRKKDRTGLKCPGCRHAFAFDPTAGDVVTDALFKAAIDAVSSGGSVRWGVEHLFYEVNRRKRGKPAPIGCLVVSAVLLVVFLQAARSEITASWVPTLILAGVVFALAYERLRGRPLRSSTAVSIPQSKFDAMWQRWQAVHGKPEGLIVRKPQPPSARRPAESDVADYSFDRAVICDRARTVDLLLANNFHFENNCAVLSIEGYPPGPFETVRAMLQRNPRLEVFALHDANAAGCRLAYRLAHDRRWFLGRVVVDVGLRPEHAGPFRGLLLKVSEVVSAGDAVSREDAEWLSRWTLELAAIRPEQVLKRLYRALNRQADAPAARTRAARAGRRNDATVETTYTSSSDGGSAGSVDYDAESFSSDAGDGEGSADGFG